MLLLRLENKSFDFTEKSVLQINVIEIWKFADAVQSRFLRLFSHQTRVLTSLSFLQFRFEWFQFLP